VRRIPRTDTTLAMPTGVIIGCALEVHRTLRPGFREIVYQRPLALELQAAGLEFEREVKVPIIYKGH